MLQSSKTVGDVSRVHCGGLWVAEGEIGGRRGLITRSSRPPTNFMTHQRPPSLSRVGWPQPFSFLLLGPPVSPLCAFHPISVHILHLHISTSLLFSPPRTAFSDRVDASGCPDESWPEGRGGVDRKELDESGAASTREDTAGIWCRTLRISQSGICIAWHKMHKASATPWMLH